MTGFALDKQIDAGDAERNKEKIIQTFPVPRVVALTKTPESLCSGDSPACPVPVRVSDESKKSQTQFKCSQYQTKYADINKKTLELFSLEHRSLSPSGITSSNRPVSPAIKSIGDQTAKAAFIRTLITERLNSCSPVSWQT